MSYLDDILIAVDDKPGITKDELLTILNNSSKTAVYSAIARLVSRKLIKDLGTGFTISARGKERLNDFLDSLVDFKQENKKWFLVLVEIPENQKLIREKLRYEFKKAGVGTLKKGVYVFYSASDQKILEILKSLLVDHIALVVTLNNPNKKTIEKIIGISWQWQDINKEYKNFLESTNNLLLLINQQSKDVQRIQAKSFVAQFAKLIRRDPKIPNNLLPTNSLRAKAYLAYEKLRPYCYN